MTSIPLPVAARLSQLVSGMARSSCDTHCAVAVTSHDRDVVAEKAIAIGTTLGYQVVPISGYTYMPASATSSTNKAVAAIENDGPLLVVMVAGSDVHQQRLREIVGRLVQAADVAAGNTSILVITDEGAADQMEMLGEMTCMTGASIPFSIID